MNSLKPMTPAPELPSVKTMMPAKRSRMTSHSQPPGIGSGRRRREGGLGCSRGGMEHPRYKSCFHHFMQDRAEPSKDSDWFRVRLHTRRRNPASRDQLGATSKPYFRGPRRARAPARLLVDPRKVCPTIAPVTSGRGLASGALRETGITCRRRGVVTDFSTFLIMR